MAFLDTMDDLGVRCVIYPMSFLARLHLLNTFDDIGVILVCRPLRYIHRFAAFLLDTELIFDSNSYPIRFAHPTLESLKADESIVSSTSRCSTSLAGGGSGSSRGGSRVSERGRIRKRSKGSRSSGSGTLRVSERSRATATRPCSKDIMRINGRA